MKVSVLRPAFISPTLSVELPHLPSCPPHHCSKVHGPNGGYAWVSEATNASQEATLWYSDAGIREFNFFKGVFNFVGKVTNYEQRFFV